MTSRIGLGSEELSALFARQNGCVKCLDTSPTCPTCADGQVCQISSPSCSKCSEAYCAVDLAASASASSSTGSKSNTGAIVGGVVGGLAAIAIVTYIVWRYCVKARRDSAASESWAENHDSKVAAGEADDFASAASQRQSTHSNDSMASTVLTRASNIIQIAYIPGVTNRATPTTPTMLVPPVPPLPRAHSDNESASAYEEQHFFVPGALRNSTYSGISSLSDRDSVAATSYAPRSSVASTIYGKNAVVSSTPAQKGTLLKPSIVSVKSKGASTAGSVTGSGGNSTPPVPSLPAEYEPSTAVSTIPPSPSFSIGTSFFQNANAATTVRPQVVRVGNGPKMVNVKASTPATVNEETETETATSPNPTLLSPGSGTKDLDTAASLTIVNPSQDTARTDQGPFRDPPTPKSTATKRNSNLGAIIEEASRAQNSRRNSKAVTERGRSPFGDEHAMRD